MTCSAVADAAARALLVLALLGAMACGSAPARSPGDLTNPFLGPELASWLTGPVARLATPEEIQAFLAITSDEQAREFVESFWARRDSNGDNTGNPLRETFDRRSEEADRAFTEAGYLGRRTDRGAVYVLYGPPRKTDYEVSAVPGESTIEVWFYDETARAGLDGKRPRGAYRFIKRGDLTVTYVPGRPDPRLRDRPGRPPDVP